MNARPDRFPTLALLAAVVLALTACGNKGPLVLPDRPEEAAAPADESAPADMAPADDADAATDETPAAGTPAETIDDADAPVAPPPEDG